MCLYTRPVNACYRQLHIEGLCTCTYLQYLHAVEYHWNPMIQSNAMYVRHSYSIRQKLACLVPVDWVLQEKNNDNIKLHMMYVICN